MGKFKKGLFLGGILGTAVTWMNTTVKGKAFREKLVEQAAEIFSEVKEQALASKTWENMKKNEYVKMVQAAVDKYAHKHGLAEDVKNTLVRLLSSQWKHFKKGK